MKIFFSSGEVSGDVVGARLACELGALRPDAVLFGIGGSRMASAGIEVIVSTNHLGTVGIAESFKTAPSLVRAFFRVRRHILSERPDSAVLIGNDVFNVLLGRWLKSKGIPTISYFPPQVWIWRSLARRISKSFDLVLTCFPEESTVYRRAGATVSFVGHYLCDSLARTTAEERAAARGRLDLPAGARVVGLLPGSRVHEVSTLAPALLDAARELSRRDPALLFVLPLAEPLFRGKLERAIAARGLLAKVRLADASHEAMRAADVVVLASGTATLEAALLGVPMVVVYRVAPLTFGVVKACIGLSLIDSDTVGLPNLILGRRAVPELIQNRVEAEAIAREAWSLLDDPARREAMGRDLEEVARRIHGGGSLRKAAECVLRVAEAAPAWFAPAGERPAVPEGGPFVGIHAQDDR